mgnify:CR=1 FL=1
MIFVILTTESHFVFSCSSIAFVKDCDVINGQVHCSDTNLFGKIPLSSNLQFYSLRLKLCGPRGGSTSFLICASFYYYNIKFNQPAVCLTFKL